MGRTLDVLNPEFLDKPWREHTGCKRTTEDGTELGVQTTDTHVFEFKVGSNNGVWGRSGEA
jgi:hypothetical protein